MKREFQKSDFVRLQKPYKDEFEYGIVTEYDAEKQICTLLVINNGDKIDLPEGEIEYLPPVVFTEELLKKLIRYEYTFQDYLKAAQVDGNWKCEDVYEFTLDDMIAAVDNLLKKNADKEELCNWAELVGSSLEDYFENSEDVQYDSSRTFMGYLYPACDSTMADCIYSALTNGGYYGDVGSDPEPVDLPLIKEDIQNYRQDKPMREYMWSTANKLYALKLTDDDKLRSLSPEEIGILRGLLLEFSMKDNPTAIRKLGYCYYGGNRLFPCNWPKSRDCFEKLMRMDAVSDENKCRYANTLGYIYYYGRCNGGTPEYEKAYRCFTLGAAGGMYESMYKLADMYQNGYYVPKNTRAASALVSMVYEQNYDLFIKGQYDCKFADAALRMGNLSRDDDAYYYYTLADFAIRKRLKYDRYGDERVLSNIQKELMRMREEHPLKDRSTFKFNSLPNVLIRLMDKFSCKFDVKMLESDLEVTATRLPQPGQKVPVPIFECYPEYGFCRLTDSVTFTAHIAGDAPLDMGASASFIADGIARDGVNNKPRYRFTHHGEEVFAFTASQITYTLPEDNAEGKAVRTLVSVVFAPGGREYDYICDLRGVKPGDRVIVDANGEEQVVTVTRVYQMALDDMPLKVDKYKKVLGREGE